MRRPSPRSRPDPTSAGDAPAFVTMLTDRECWEKLPPAAQGAGQPLPSWTRAVAAQLPRTAAAMLELDLAQRTKSPLDPKLRARMRWVVARSNRCGYSEAYALADARRAGVDEAGIATLTGDPSAWAAEDREPLEFARLLTVDATAITDAQFAKLVDRFGAKRVAAMVLLGAYGNYQDRLVLGLGLAMEPGGPLAPLDVRFAPGAIQLAPPEQPASPSSSIPPSADLAGVVEPDPEWSELSFEELQARLDGQRAETPRLPIPTWEEVRRGLPPEYPATPTRIVWTLTCLGYAPDLAVPWGRATRTFWSESRQDRVFEESLFWVQTRALRCNYCMGHCEMLLEVAGLDPAGVADRARRLATDWASFPPAEQRAYAYARKLTKTPWALTAADYKTLVDDQGSDRAMATFWWLCRGLYMTRISDGFGFPLERVNVFDDMFPPRPSAG